MTASNSSRAAPLTRRIHQAQAWQYSVPARDLALLGARIGLAWIFIYHGSQTLFSAFGGQGIHGQAEFFSSTAHLRPGTFFAVLNGITEFFGGIAVGVGLFSRLAAAGLMGDMVIAMITVTWNNGIVSDAVGSGYELNVALAALALVVALMGAGRLALDALIRDLRERGDVIRRPTQAVGATDS